MPVYHNRALWPFVTAYGLRAATHVKNVAVADAAYDSLMRGAALNMSNMENLEWLSGLTHALEAEHLHRVARGRLLAAGAGVQWKFGHWAIRSEYERFTALGEHPSLISVAATWWFL